MKRASFAMLSSMSSGVEPPEYSIIRCEGCKCPVQPGSKSYNSNVQWDSRSEGRATQRRQTTEETNTGESCLASESHRKQGTVPEHARRAGYVSNTESYLQSYQAQSTAAESHSSEQRGNHCLVPPVDSPSLPMVGVTSCMQRLGMSRTGKWGGPPRPDRGVTG